MLGVALTPTVSAEQLHGKSEAPGELPEKYVACEFPNPTYPLASRAAGEEGTVKLRGVVDYNGRDVIEVTVTSTSGFERIDEAAKNAFLGAKCETHGYSDRQTSVSKTYQFTLR